MEGPTVLALSQDLTAGTFSWKGRSENGLAFGGQRLIWYFFCYQTLMLTS